MLPLQEDIKILKISVFVNPYTEPDEEEVKLKESSETAENEAENVSARYTPKPACKNA